MTAITNDTLRATLAEQTQACGIPKPLAESFAELKIPTKPDWIDEAFREMEGWTYFPSGWLPAIKATLRRHQPSAPGASTPVAGETRDRYEGEDGQDIPWRGPNEWCWQLADTFLAAYESGEAELNHQALATCIRDCGPWADTSSAASPLPAPASSGAESTTPKLRNLPCICCGRFIKPDWCGSPRAVEIERIDNVGWDGGIAGSLSGGFGSSHDTQVFAVAICDSCIEDKMHLGNLLRTHGGVTSEPVSAPPSVGEELVESLEGLATGIKTGSPFMQTSFRMGEDGSLERVRELKPLRRPTRAGERLPSAAPGGDSTAETCIACGGPVEPGQYDCNACNGNGVPNPVPLAVGEWTDMCREMGYLRADFEKAVAIAKGEYMPTGDDANGLHTIAKAVNRLSSPPSAVAGESTEHDLYKTGDADAPSVIKDSNGEVVLGLCRRCGKGECELSGPCQLSAVGEVLACHDWGQRVLKEIGYEDGSAQWMDRIEEELVNTRAERDSLRDRISTYKALESDSNVDSLQARVRELEGENTSLHQQIAAMKREEAPSRGWITVKDAP